MVESAVIIEAVEGGKEDAGLKRDGEALGDLGGGTDRSGQVGLVEIEANAAAGEGVVEDDGQSIAGSDGLKQAAGIAAVVNIVQGGESWLGFDREIIGLGDDLRGT